MSGTMGLCFLNYYIKIKENAGRNCSYSTQNINMLLNLRFELLHP